MSEGGEESTAGRGGDEIVDVRGVAATVGLLVLAVASLAGVAALLIERSGAEWVFAAVCAVFPPALIAVGATRRGSCDRPTVVACWALFAVLAGSLAALFWLRGQGAGEGYAVPAVAGVPLPVAVLLGGVWLVPLAFVGLAYALTFDRHGVDADDLEELRRVRREMEDGDGRDGAGRPGNDEEGGG